MTDLVLEVYDRFTVHQDLIALIREGLTGESVLASSVYVSRDVAREKLSFMLAQGYIKTARSDTEFRITALGSNSAGISGHEEISLLGTLLDAHFFF